MMKKRQIGCIASEGVENANTSSKRTIITSVAIAAIVFTLDLIAPLGVAGGVPYVVLVLFGWTFGERSAYFTMATFASVLTILGYFFSPEGGIPWVVFTNRFYAIFAIWSTAIVLWWIAKRKEQFFDQVKPTQKRGYIHNISFLKENLVVFVLLIVILASSCGVILRIEAKAKNDLMKSLSTTLKTSHTSIKIMFESQRKVVEFWANNVRLRAITKELINLSNTTNTLITSSSLASLRDLLTPVNKILGYRGFFIIGEDNTNLASSRDNNIGTMNLLTEQPELLDRLWSGETLITLPQPSDVPLLDTDGGMIPGLSTMFVATSIKDEMGKIMAILTLRIDPVESFTKVFERGHFGDSGEIYAFNNKGLLISESRFNDQLRKIGLLPSGKHSNLHIELRDPGVDLTLGQSAALLRGKQPLTAMAQSGIAKESGENLDGYRDYRGVPVVGVWTWDDELGFGIATEVDTREAFALLSNMRFIIAIFTFLVVGSLLVLVKVYASVRKTIEERDAKNSLILSSIGEGVIGLDIKGRVTFVNPKASEMLGYTVEEFINCPISMVQHSYPDGTEYPPEKNLLCSIIADGRVHYVDDEIMWHKDGPSFPVEYTSTPIINNGKSTGAVVSFMDISKRKEAEAELKKLSSVVEQNPISIIITNREGIIEYINPAFTKISGYTAEEVIGNTPRKLKSGLELKELYEELWRTITSGRNWKKEIRNKNKNGEIYWESAFIAPIRSQEGNITHFVGLLEDISQRKQIEQKLKMAHENLEDLVKQRKAQLALKHEELKKETIERLRAYGEKEKLERLLQQSQKMEAIGALAGGIAHDFNNILSAVQGYTELAIMDLSEENQVRECLDQVLDASYRAKELVQQILTFSRKSDQEFKPLQVQLIAKEVIKLLRSSIPATITIKPSIDLECNNVLADPIQIYQVIMNLCTNSYHAMRQSGGILGVSLQQIELDQEDLKEKINLKPGTYLKLEISDTGIGITSDIQDKIFEPYFTTKDQGKGTGLGLSVVHGIIANLDGDISVYSEPDIGTTFHVYLPVVEANEQIAQERDTRPLPTGKERILLVDDDDTIVLMRKRMLEKLGYSVSGLTDSVETLQIFQKTPDKFDLVVSDMTMPKMTGAELTKKILVIRPDMPIILCTGFSELLNEKKATDIGVRKYLTKPVRKIDFATAVRDTLDEDKRIEIA